MDEKIRVLLADDHAMLREGTVALLQREDDIEVVGQASDGRETVELAHRLEPDIVIMDVRMPELSGIEATRQIREALPSVQVLVLTAHDDEQYIFSLLEAGASGYLLKTAPVSELVKAIRQVEAGESPLSPSIARKIVVRMSHQEEKSPDSAQENGNLNDLTSRELEVLRLLAQGMSNRAIAENMSVSERTVHAHLSNIFSKMGVSSRLEAVLLAIRRGWLTLEL